MDKKIEPFVIAFGELDPELESFKIHRLIESPKIRNGQWIIRCRAVDVSVRKPSGLALINFLRGKNTIIGKVDLDKDRECSVSEELAIPLKEGGDPPAYALFAKDFDKLPRGFREHKYFGTAFAIAYLAMKSDEAKAELLEDAGLQQTEIMDILSQSQSKASDYIISTYKAYNQADEQNLKSQVQDKKNQEDREMY